MAGLSGSSSYPAAGVTGTCAQALQQASEAVTLSGSGEGVAVISADVASAQQAGEKVRACRTKLPSMSVASDVVHDNGLTRQVFLIAGSRFAVGQYRNVVLDFQYSAESYDVGQLNREFPTRADAVG